VLSQVKIGEVSVGQDGRYALAITIDHDGDVSVVTDMDPAWVVAVLGEVRSKIARAQRDGAFHE